MTATPPPLPLEPSTYWLSFSDVKKPKGQRFLGVCLVEANPDDIADAITAAWTGECNPGGEVLFIEFPYGELPPALENMPRNSLLSSEALKEGGWAP